MTNEILLTGGAGYIGSHTCVELIQTGFLPVIVDNLSNSSLEAVRRVEVITGVDIPFYEVDVRDADGLRKVLDAHDIVACIHFAGLKAVGESVAKPLMYFDNNVSGSVTLLSVLKEYSIDKFVFSSSATVYGDPAVVPISENSSAGLTTNPYGRSKWVVEEILRDLYQANSSSSIAILRYFNPVGAHVSGSIGEDPTNIPNNLMPYISQTAIGKRGFISVFGNDYPTKDGTGVRDYIHVVDLAKGHVASLNKIFANSCLITVNLGTGIGYSVLEVIKSFEKASGKKINYKIVTRRDGDIAECFADPTYAKKVLNWSAELNINDMCKDSWHWQSMNPNGYQK